MPERPPAESPGTTGRKPETAPRRAGLRALAVSLPRVTKRLFGQRGFAEGGLAADWSGIVGAGLAARCRPGKLAFARATERRDGTLTLRVEAPFATEVQHLAPQIMERINGYFGYRAVARLKLLQGPLPKRRKASPPAARALEPGEEEELVRSLCTVDDPELRQALESLGRAVIGRRAGKD